MSKKSGETLRGIIGLVAIGAGVLWWMGAFTPNPAKPTVAGAPPSEAQFVATAAMFAKRYDAAANDIAQVPVRAARAKALCRLANTATDWTGKVTSADLATFSHSGHRSATLEVSISPHVSLTTNGAKGFDPERTLIPESSPLYTIAATLRAGQKVQFSGVFFSDPKDCLREVSLTESGMMDDPEFLFRFTGLGPPGGKMVSAGTPGPEHP